MMRISLIEGLFRCQHNIVEKGCLCESGEVDCVGNETCKCFKSRADVTIVGDVLTINYIATVTKEHYKWCEIEGPLSSDDHPNFSLVSLKDLPRCTVVYQGLKGKAPTWFWALRNTNTK